MDVFIAPYQAHDLGRRARELDRRGRCVHVCKSAVCIQHFAPKLVIPETLKAPNRVNLNGATI